MTPFFTSNYANIILTAVSGFLLGLVALTMLLRLGVAVVNRRLKQSSGGGEFVPTASFGKIRPAYLNEGIVETFPEVVGQQIPMPSWKTSLVTAFIQLNLWLALHGLGLGLSLFADFKSVTNVQAFVVMEQLFVFVASMTFLAVIPRYTLQTTILRAASVSVLQIILMGVVTVLAMYATQL